MNTTTADTRTARAAANAYVAADRSLTRANKGARMAMMNYTSTAVYGMRAYYAEEKMAKAAARLQELGKCVNCALENPQTPRCCN